MTTPDSEPDLAGLQTLQSSGKSPYRGMRVVVTKEYNGEAYAWQHGECTDNDSIMPDVKLDNFPNKIIVSWNFLYSEEDWDKMPRFATVWDPNATQFTIRREDIEALIRDAHDAAPEVAEKLRKILDPRTERTFSVSIKSLDPQETLAKMQKAVEGEAEIAISDEGESYDLF